MTYNRHIPEKKILCHFLKKNCDLKKKLSLAGSKPAVLLERLIVWGHQYRMGCQDVTDIVCRLVWGDGQLAYWQLPPANTAPNNSICRLAAMSE